MYEQFAQELIREYLGFLEANFQFSELDENFRTCYRVGIAKILEKKDGPRYGQLVLEQIVQDFSCALSGKGSYRIEPVAMLMQEQNLRLPELARLCTNCGVGEVYRWIEQHPSMKSFFEDESRVAASADNELAALIGYRNDAAHGGLAVDDVAGLDVLFELANFINLLCHVLAERLRKAVLEKSLQKKLALKCGEVTESLKDGLVIIAPVVGDFHIGQLLYLIGKGYCVERKIVSIQRDGIDLNNIVLTEAAELGFGLNDRAKEGASIVTMLPSGSKNAPDNTVLPA
jgi:hypothetical protein